MMRTVFLCFSLLLLACESLEAAVISVPDIEITEGTTSVDVIVGITGGESVFSLQGLILVGDGGAVLGNPAGPMVTGVDLSNSIWISAPGGVDSILYSTGPPSTAPPAELVDPSFGLTNNPAETVAASGELLRFTVDTSGLLAGDVISVTMDTLASFGQGTTLGGPGGTLNPTFAPTGSISVVSAVPEPSSFLALGAVGAGTAWRRRRRTGKPVAVV